MLSLWQRLNSFTLNNYKLTRMNLEEEEEDEEDMMMFPSFSYPCAQLLVCVNTMRAFYIFIRANIPPFPSSLHLLS